MGQNLLKTYLVIFFHDVHVIKDLCYSFAKTYVPNHIFDVVSKNIESYDDTPEARENCIKVAILLFAGYVDGATSIAESCGGGGSPGGGWGRDKDEDEDARARRAAQKASWLCKPMGRTYKRK